MLIIRIERSGKGEPSWVTIPSPPLANYLLVRSGGAGRARKIHSKLIQRWGFIQNSFRKIRGTGGNREILRNGEIPGGAQFKTFRR